MDLDQITLLGYLQDLACWLWPEQAFSLVSEHNHVLHNHTLSFALVHTDMAANSSGALVYLPMLNSRTVFRTSDDDNRHRCSQALPSQLRGKSLRLPLRFAQQCCLILHSRLAELSCCFSFLFTSSVPELRFLNLNRKSSIVYTEM